MTPCLFSFVALVCQSNHDSLSFFSHHVLSADDYEGNQFRSNLLCRQDVLQVSCRSHTHRPANLGPPGTAARLLQRYSRYCI